MPRQVWIAAAAVAVIVATLGFYLSMPLAGSSGGQAMRLPADPVPLVVSTTTGDRSFTIEIADDASERARGLMFRETMAGDHGMLFVFGQTGPVAFWMKDTPMPLDLVFIGEDGRIRDIRPGESFSTASISPAEPVRFVLELKRGTASAGGIGKGDAVRHPAIDPVAGQASPGSTEAPAGG